MNMLGGDDSPRILTFNIAGVQHLASRTVVRSGLSTNPLGGQYWPLARLGAGGMGLVYRAHDARANRDAGHCVAARMSAGQHRVPVAAPQNEPKVTTVVRIWWEEADAKPGGRRLWRGWVQLFPIFPCRLIPVLSRTLE